MGLKKITKLKEKKREEHLLYYSYKQQNKCNSPKLFYYIEEYFSSFTGN
jgi:hypothetical protein